jgi:hypothetical protein
MRIAVIADIHGNMPAPEAELADILRGNIDRTDIPRSAACTASHSAPSKPILLRRRSWAGTGRCRWLQAGGQGILGQGFLGGSKECCGDRAFAHLCSVRISVSRPSRREWSQSRSLPSYAGRAAPGCRALHQPDASRRRHRGAVATTDPWIGPTAGLPLRAMPQGNCRVHIVYSF